VSGNVNLSHTLLNNELENQVIENDNFTQVYGLNVSAKLFDMLAVRTGYTVSINTYRSGETDNTFTNQRPSISSTFTHKGLRIDADYNYNLYKGQGQQSTFDMLDMSVSYRKGKSPWEFRVRGFNLLDTREVRRDSFSNNLISTFSYLVQQRYGLFTVMLDL